jgi:hypothetical protein
MRSCVFEVSKTLAFLLMILIEIVMAVAVHIVAVAAMMSVVWGCWGLSWSCPVITILISWRFSGFIM